MVIAYLRDFDGNDYTEIDGGSLDIADWQNGSDTWVEYTLTISSVSCTIEAGHYLELKVLVDDVSDDDMWFAYDTADYISYLVLP